jgi:hypothetical protein
MGRRGTWLFAYDRRFMEIVASSKSFDEVVKRTRRSPASVRKAALRLGVKLANVGARRASAAAKQGLSMKKKRVSSTELAHIFSERLKDFDDCSPRITIAIVPSKSGWEVLRYRWARFRYPTCQKRIEKVQAELSKIYALAPD